MPEPQIEVKRKEIRKKKTELATAVCTVFILRISAHNQLSFENRRKDTYENYSLIILSVLFRCWLSPYCVN